MTTKMEIVIQNENGELLLNKNGEVLVFETKEDAIKCVDDGRTYENLDYSQIKEMIVFADKGKEIFDRNKAYWG